VTTEEFLVVLINCQPAYGFARAEQIHKATALKPVQTSNGAVPITMSLGLLLSHEWGNRPVEVLLQEADAALYVAKAAGRNCVKIATPAITSVYQDSRAPQPARRS
jgi:diguanylate cyclase (GGDEF)-like protein